MSDADRKKSAEGRQLVSDFLELLKIFMEIRDPKLRRTIIEAIGKMPRFPRVDDSH